MKIPKSFLNVYEPFSQELKALGEYVKPRLSKIASQSKGTFDERIKTPESLIIKAEQAGAKKPFLEFDDLYACSIVVPSTVLVGRVLEEVAGEFEIVENRRKLLPPEKFAYDDVNLTLRIKKEENLKNKFAQIKFELQIKTLLQQAWGSANHDLIYKGKKKSWGLVRVSSQIRALLEMADAVLTKLEQSAENLQRNQLYEEYELRNQIVDLLAANWANDRLPEGVFRLAEVIESYLKLTETGLEELKQRLGEGSGRLYVQTGSLTPSQAIFIVLFLKDEKKALAALEESKLPIYVSQEMLEICPAVATIPDTSRIEF
jgi:ppGpp synthetase/RelA/SpoT-type nucleotidyltranferase